MDATTRVPTACNLMATALLVLVPMRAAQAQTRSDPRLAFQGSLGYGQTWDDEGRLGGGLGAETSVEVRILRKLGLQLGVSRYSHDRSFESDVRFSGESLMFSGDVLYHFSGTRAQPFLLGGVALVRSRTRTTSSLYAYDGYQLRLVFDGSRFRPVQIGEEVSDYSEKGRGLTIGGGVEIPLGPRLVIRTEARCVFIRRISGSIGLSYRW